MYDAPRPLALVADPSRQIGGTLNQLNKVWHVWPGSIHGALVVELVEAASNRRNRSSPIRGLPSFSFSDLLQIEWVKLGGFSQVECDSKGFFVNVTVTSSRHVCAHAKIEQDEAPER